MEAKIKDLLRQCKGINSHTTRKLAIVNNYDIIYRTMVADGMSRLVAHTWTMLELSRLHGRRKVERVLESPACC